MPHPPITPILLCGGSGTRLWPLSRKSYPKQFSRITGQDSLFQAAALRLSGAGFRAPMVLTNSDFRFIVTEQLLEAGIDPGPVLIEPKGRNTAPALLAAAICQAQTDPGHLMLAAPSDHLIPDAAAFRSAIAAGMTAAQDGQLVTFGITPDRPETGYGYLELAQRPTAATTPIPLSRFVEKPDAVAAKALVASGNNLWNAGIFLFTAQNLIDAFAEFAPDILQSVGDAVAQATQDLGFLRLAPGPWETTRSISIDYAVMEQARNLMVVPYHGEWSDLGGWDAVWSIGDADAQGVVTSGPATAIDCENSLLRSESDGLELVGLGLRNIMAIAMPDAVLIADMSRAQDVRLAVDALKARKAEQAEGFPKSHRPWGFFERLIAGDRFQVKRIMVHPGAALSLQSHVHRAEHWIVVAGTARVTIDDEVRLLSENQSIYVPLGSRHRLENPGRVPMVLIEVQSGSYLGEDDITRYADAYARDRSE